MLRFTFALILACLSFRYEGCYSLTVLRPNFLGYSAGKEIYWKVLILMSKIHSLTTLKGSRSVTRVVVAPLQSSVMIEKDFTVSTNGVKFSTLEGFNWIISTHTVHFAFLFFLKLIYFYAEGKALLRKETPTLLSVKAAIGSVRRWKLKLLYNVIITTQIKSLLFSFFLLCSSRSTIRSMGFAALDLLTVSACAVAGHALFPLAASLWQASWTVPLILPSDLPSMTSSSSMQKNRI